MSSSYGLPQRIAFIGIGGNLGNPPETMSAALRLIDGRKDTQVTGVSRLYRTPPWGMTDQPFFHNACARVVTSLTAHELLDICLATERRFKRDRRERWGPRTLDLDILDYAGEATRDDRLKLPHPRLAERAFVLIPLAEIAPDILVGDKPIAMQIASLDRTGIEPLTHDGTWWHSQKAL